MTIDSTMPIPATTISATSAIGMIAADHHQADRRRAADLDGHFTIADGLNRARRTPRKTGVNTMLSDACWDFLGDAAQGRPEHDAATELLRETNRYSKHPYNYSPEIIDWLREAVSAFLKTETAETRAHLWRTTSLAVKFIVAANCRQDDGREWPTPLTFDFWARAELAARPEEYEVEELRRQELAIIGELKCKTDWRTSNWRKSNWPPRGCIFVFKDMEQAKAFAVAVKKKNVCGLDSRVLDEMLHGMPHVHVCWELERHIASKKAWDEACAVERRIEKMAAEFKRNAPKPGRGKGMTPRRHQRAGAMNMDGEQSSETRKDQTK